jgi:hypothetical protein
MPAIIANRRSQQAVALVLQIDIEHPDYVRSKAMWRKYRDLYAGGEQFREHADEYLVRRSKEPNDVYLERLSRVFYENYIGSTIDWYAATLMRREPIISYDGTNEAGRRFFTSFAEDCDLKGTTLAEFFRRQLVQTLIAGTSYIVVDFPRVVLLSGSPARFWRITLPMKLSIGITTPMASWSGSFSAPHGSGRRIPAANAGRKKHDGFITTGRYFAHTVLCKIPPGFLTPSTWLMKDDTAWPPNHAYRSFKCTSPRASG